MKKLLFLLLFLPFLGNSQATFTAPVGYNTGAPTATPSGVGTRWRIDLLTGKKYTWLPGTLSWDEDARGIDQVAGCSAPLYTPGYNQSTFAVNSCTPKPEMYQWTGAAWVQLNPETLYTEGAGIDITGGVITNTGDLSNTNEIQTLSIAGSNLSLSNGGGTVALPTTGITSLGGQTGGTQTFATGTTGTDFGISSAANTHTFNLPNSSAANRGLLTSTDWSAFNSKIGGSGTSGYLPKFSGGSTLANSLIYDNGTNTGIGTASPTAKFDVRGGAVFIHSAPTGGATAGGVGVYDWTPNESSNSTVGITGTNKAVWTSPGNGIVFKNHVRQITVGSKTNFIDAIAVDAPWLGSTEVESAQEVLRVNAVTNNVYNVAMKYASSPYPSYHVSAKDVFFNVKSAAAWPDGVSVTTFGTNMLSIKDVGVGVGTGTAVSYLDVDGANGYSQFRLRDAYTPTGTADALGATGDTAWDENYFYIKTAAGWKRTALSTF